MPPGDYPANPGTGWQEPQYLLADVMDHDDDYFDKALEGFALSLPLTRRSLHLPLARVNSGVYLRQVMEKAVARVAKSRSAIRSIRQPRWVPKPMNDQLEKILNYIKIGKEEGAKCVTGGNRRISATAF